MHYVYLLRSIEFPEQTYIGYTTDLKARLKKHNEGGSPHTAKYRPWKIVSYHAFEEKQRAIEFEKYLKSISFPEIRVDIGSLFIQSSLLVWRLSRFSLKGVPPLDRRLTCRS